MKLSSFYHCLVLALIFGFIFGSFLAGTDGASRQPNSRDHIHCKMEYHEQWEDVMQTADPYAVVESYYVSIFNWVDVGRKIREKEWEKEQLLMVREAAEDRSLLLCFPFLLPRVCVSSNIDIDTKSGNGNSSFVCVCEFLNVKVSRFFCTCS